MDEQQAKFVEDISLGFKGKADRINESDKNVIRAKEGDPRELLVGKEKEEVEEDYLSDLGKEQDKLKNIGNDLGAVSEKSINQIVDEFNELAGNQEEWNDDFAYPNMEVAFDNQTIRYEWKHLVDPQQGWKKIVKYITIAQAKKELEEWKKNIDEVGSRYTDDSKKKIEEIVVKPTFTYNEISNLPEYKALIDMGLKDVTGPVQKNRASAVMFDSDVYRYTAYSNGKIRRAKKYEGGGGAGVSSTIAELRSVQSIADFAAILKTLAEKASQEAEKVKKKEWSKISGSNAKVKVPDDLIRYMIEKMRKKGYILADTLKNNAFGNDAILYDFKKKGRKEVTIWFEAKESGWSWKRGVSSVNFQSDNVASFHDKNDEYGTTSDPVWIRSAIDKAIARAK